MGDGAPKEREEEMSYPIYKFDFQWNEKIFVFRSLFPNFLIPYIYYLYYNINNIIWLCVEFVWKKIE